VVSEALEPLEVTLVFVHGAGGTPLSWQLQLHHFKDALAIGLPGHPEGKGSATIREYVEALAKYLENNCVTKPILVGHSMGGAIAIEYALTHSNLDGLVLVGTGARLRVRVDLVAKMLENYEEASKVFARLSVSPSCDQVVVERIAREMLKVKAEVTYGDLQACNGFDRMNDVEKITTRTLVICGADDLLTPPKYSQYLHEKIRNSKLVIVPGAGHSVMLEKHRQFNEAIEAFQDSLPISGPAT
jgi:pimeloyl-ACP methyl ester carboxylesterase